MEKKSKENIFNQIRTLAQGSFLFWMALLCTAIIYMLEGEVSGVVLFCVLITLVNMFVIKYQDQKGKNSKRKKR